MSGNVREWCWDFYEKHYGDHSSAQTDPTGPLSGLMKIFRGGSWNTDSASARVANRGAGGFNGGGRDFGFRPVRRP